MLKFELRGESVSKAQLFRNLSSQLGSQPLPLPVGNKLSDFLVRAGGQLCALLINERVLGVELARFLSPLRPTKAERSDDDHCDRCGHEYPVVCPRPSKTLEKTGRSNDAVVGIHRPLARCNVPAQTITERR